MKINRLVSLLVALTLLISVSLVAAKEKKTKDRGTVTIHGYVIDSACAIRRDLDKPISKDCAIVIDTIEPMAAGK